MLLRKRPSLTHRIRNSGTSNENKCHTTQQSWKVRVGTTHDVTRTFTGWR
jgi:hypothetical protein